MPNKHIPLSAIVVISAALLAWPALAQNAAPPSPAAAAPPAAAHGAMKMPAAKRPAKKVKVAKLTCMDYAWQSQDEKDCEAGKIKPPNWR